MRHTTIDTLYLLIEIGMWEEVYNYKIGNLKLETRILLLN